MQSLIGGGRVIAVNDIMDINIEHMADERSDYEGHCGFSGMQDSKTTSFHEMR